MDPGVAILLLLACPALLGQGLVREEKSVAVDGATEVWRLVWKSAPGPACSADDVEAFTCPCTGFAFGEAGQIDLVRLKDGHEIDRLSLTPLFRDAPVHPAEAIVQRWETHHGDITSDARQLTRRVHNRPVVSVMDLADYDHDGRSTEFFLQTGTLPCGKRVGVVIGLWPATRGCTPWAASAIPESRSICKSSNGMRCDPPQVRFA